MRITFLTLILVHGLIHLMGFAKAFGLAEINQLTREISKPIGLIWLFVALLFLIVGVQYFLRSEFWWIAGLIAVFISQILVFMYWQDAKAGTIANVIILIVSLISYGNWSFDNNVEAEIAGMFKNQDLAGETYITADMLSDLPESVRLWLNNSGVVGKTKTRTVRLKQTGEMRLKPENKDWIKTSAVQYFRTDTSSFIWKVEMNMIPLVPLSGRDKFIDGKGNMLIKLFSLFNMVNECGPKIDQGAAQRYLAELCWFPSAALSPYITWEPVDSFSAKATLNFQNINTSVVFHFDTSGKILEITADRFKDNTPEAQPEKWIVQPLEYQKVNGIVIPVKLEVNWGLESGDFTWYRLEVEEVLYDFELP